jgi:hypothetical protein
MVSIDIQLMEMIIHSKRQHGKNPKFACVGTNSLQKGRDVLQIPNIGIFDNIGGVIEMEGIV